MRANPSIEIIARDRAGAYSEAAEIALPQAEQVCDRWHLLSNLRDNVERMLQRMGPQMRQAAQRVVVTDATLGRQGRGHGQPRLTWWQQLSDDRRSIRLAQLRAGDGTARPGRHDEGDRGRAIDQQSHREQVRPRRGIP
jgi:hypothetical protein